MQQYRTQKVCDFPLYYYLIGYPGIVLTIITQLIIVYFFRNYEFREKNAIRRRYSRITVLQVALRAALTADHYLQIGNVLYLKTFIVHALGASYIFDFVMNWPFFDKQLSRFYACAVLIFEELLLIQLAWIYGGADDSIFFYLILIVSACLIGLGCQLYWYSYERLMTVSKANIRDRFAQIDFFLEEISRLTVASDSNDDARYVVLQKLIQHR